MLTDDGFEIAGELATLTVVVPVTAGVYVKVWGRVEEENVRLAGVNVPPAPLSDGVIVPL